MLHDTIVFLRRRHQLPAFENVMAARLLDVDVLARLARPDADQRVPVVGRGDRDRIDGFVFQQLPHIGVSGGPLLSGAGHFSETLVQDVLVHVAQRRDLHILHLRILADVRIALAPNTDAGHPHRVVDTRCAFHRGRANGSRGAHQEMSSVHFFLAPDGPILSPTAADSYHGPPGNS
jgi:hypothetical protein